MPEPEPELPPEGQMAPAELGNAPAAAEGMPASGAQPPMDINAILQQMGGM